jgi:hypothetical protein
MEYKTTPGIYYHVAAMAEFWGDEPAAEAHVERFRVLLRQVRRGALNGM